jgi:hypothetical protein
MKARLTALADWLRRPLITIAVNIALTAAT